MKKRVIPRLLSVMCCLLATTNISFALGTHEHDYVNGFCECGAYDPAAYVDSTGVYEISNAGQLYWFARLVNEGIDGISQTRSAKAKLTGDIMVNESSLTNDMKRVWTPIGKDENTYFEGEFDGDGHSIDGLYLNDDNRIYVALVGRSNGATIKNVGVKNCVFSGGSYVEIAGVCAYAEGGAISGCYSTGIIEAAHGCREAAGVCGYAQNTTISNCYNASSVSSPRNVVAGVCGEAENCTINDCYNIGSITGDVSYAAGVCGYAKNTTISNCHNAGAITVIEIKSKVAGVVATAKNITINNSYNTGAITGGGNSYAAGVCSYADDLSISDCYNTGVIKCGHASSMGGICGSVGATTTMGSTISNCYNTASIIGGANMFMGGVCGFAFSDVIINNCYNTGDMQTNYNSPAGGVCGKNIGSISNCYSTGSITIECDVNEVKAGGVCGYNEGSISNCYCKYEKLYDESSTGSTDELSSVKSDAVFASGEVAYILSHDSLDNLIDGTPWGQKIGTDISPTLKDSMVYRANCTEFTNDVNAQGTLNDHKWKSSSFTEHECVLCGEKGNHVKDNNGFCSSSHCDYYEPAIKVDTFTYEIHNAGQLYWFANIVNNGIDGIFSKFNARLMADIVLNEGESKRQWTPIGINKLINDIFQGTFDGNGHTISGLYITEEMITEKMINQCQTINCALFGTIQNATIKDLGVIDCSVAVCKKKTKVNINVATLFGTALGTSTISNCYSTGSVKRETNKGYEGGLGGYSSTTSVTISNCYSAVSLPSKYDLNKDPLCYGQITFNNCYYMTDTSHYAKNEVLKGEEKAKEQFQSGEVAYLLSQGCEINGVTYSGDIWGQDLSDEKSYPVLGGPKVNFNEQDSTYDNNTEKPTYNPQNNTYYIANAKQLDWFAKYAVNQDTNNTKANAILIKDIVVNENVLKQDGTLNTDKQNEFIACTLIGYYKDHNNGSIVDEVPFCGVFDGQGHTISGLYFNDSTESCVGLFGCNKGTIKNVGILDSYFNGNERVGGVCGYNYGEATITNCYNTGSVSGKQGVGGICGENYATITNCFNTGSISGNERVGGVCGMNYNATIENCYNIGSFVGGANSQYVGGVCGYNNKIAQCHNIFDFYSKDSLSLLDFCNGTLLDGFSPDIWEVGSITNDNDVLIFTLPHFKKGYIPTVSGTFSAQAKSGMYFADEIFTKERLDLSVSYLNSTVNEIPEAGLSLENVDLSKSQTISGNYYGIEFSFDLTLSEYSFKEPVFSWNADTASALFVCNEKESHNVVSPCDVSIDSFVYCSKEGQIRYFASVQFKDVVYHDTMITAIPAPGHAFGEPTFAWEGFASATATFVCEKGDSTAVVKGSISSDTTLATCTADGEILYTATFSFNDSTYTDSKKVILSKSGHSFGDPTFAWEGFASATATFVCEKGDSTVIVKGSISSDTTLATCTADGEILYTATFTFNNSTYTDSKKVILSKSGHSFGEPTFAWEEYASATATFVCEKGDSTVVVKGSISSDTTLATCTADGEILYTATFSFNNSTYTDSKKVILSKSGHSFGEPSFAWEEFASATATFVCEKGDSTVVVKGSISSDTTLAPTVDTEGLVVYTATFSFGGNTFTDTKEKALETLPILTHDEVTRQSSIVVWGSGRAIHIENGTGIAQVYDVNGRLLKSVEITDDHITVSTDASNVYIVIVDGKTYKIRD